MPKSTETCSRNDEAKETTSRNKDYVLATGPGAVDRLHLLDQIFGPASRQLLANVGLSSACRIAEIGCGTGLMTNWIAERVGTRGSVSAVDNSEQQITVASENAQAAGLQNIFFHMAPADDTRMLHGSFDLVYSRFLMCHLPNPLAALREMWSLLKAGGILSAKISR